MIASLSAAPMPPGVIEVVFATGARLRISGPVDTPIVSAVMQALADCGRR
jgi:DMSO/TMAO reductase YedYZ molybdopterin-dependent catalytic subunit